MLVRLFMRLGKKRVFSAGLPFLHQLIHPFINFREQVLSLRRIDSDIEGHPTPRLEVGFSSLTISLSHTH